jgi:hypothetical protein
MGGCPPHDYWFFRCATVTTREAKPDPGIPPVSLNCRVTHTGEIA